ncbi:MULTISPECIES: branched-chain amino acid ABC transporter permease [Microbacterium]|uniref:Amino acid/amide ABC transporter membrane protein 1, HAAT family n=1 Tax=Microbacterium saccharophilum TaxID=1213358 RepID=A0A7Z7CYL5_9MICO|nr:MULTISPECIES: branched-chain amino acid ABC transporter permease [Microbacterium]SFI61146.1 amino acid/amide ABC transporter membrane protein 1, HAAT family [Microbacterium saccharophilum]
MMTTILAGLSIGAVYTMVAIGYNIVFISSRVFNFAQAQFLMVGAFVALVAARQFDLPLWAAILLCAASGGIIGALEEILAIRRLAGRGAHNELVTTLGVGVLMSGAALAIFGSDPQKLIFFDETAFSFLGGRVVMVDLLLILVAILLAGIVGLVTRKSMIGLASLATSEDRDAGMLRGINVKRLALIAFVIAGALVAAVGPLVASKTLVHYHLGDLLAVKAFVALAIGGFGSYRGALIGGFVVGLLEMFGARYLGTEWQNITVFALLLVVLLVLPQGIFGRRNERVV